VFWQTTSKLMALTYFIYLLIELAAKGQFLTGNIISPIMRSHVREIRLSL